VRNKVLIAFFAVALVCIALATTAGRGSAHEPHPGLNFWIAVDGVPNCSTQNGDGTCDIAPGVSFVVGTHLDPLPGDLPHYDGYDIELLHQGVTPNHDASSDAWPDCAFPAASYDESTAPDRVIFGCASGVPPAQPSTYTGLIGTVSFVCAASGSLQLVHGITRTDVLDDQIQGHAEDPNRTDTLTINCAAGGAVPPTPAPVANRTITAPGDVTPLEPTAAAQATSTAQSQATATAKAGGTPRTGTPAPGVKSTGSNGGLAGWAIALIIVGGVAAAGAAGVVGWRVMQRGRTGAPPPAA
jgi:hypothetical protein